MSLFKSLTYAGLFFAAAALIKCTGITSGGSFAGAGSGARDFLTSTPYTSLTLEIQAVNGYAPTSTAQTQLVNFLQARLNKPGGVNIVTDPPLASPGKSSYSLEDVVNIEAANRKYVKNGAQSVAYFLFLDGGSTSDSGSFKILGQAYGESSMVIYEASIQSVSGTPPFAPSASTVESTVMEHEFGHLLGLVNVGTPITAAHQDSAHGAHCTNTQCLMYYSVDTTNFISNLLGSVPQLDTDCLNDLKANGGK